MMKKHVYYAILLFGMMLTATGCSDEDFQTPGIEQTAKGEQVTITVGLPAHENSRVAYDDESLNLTWEKGDQIRIETYDADNNMRGDILLNLTSGAGTVKAEFTGEWFAEEFDHYRVFYHTKNLEYVRAEDSTYEGQEQTGNNQTDHLNDFLLLSSGNLTKEEILQGHFLLKPQNSVFRFRIASYPAHIGKLQQLIWQSNYGGFLPSPVSLSLHLDAETQDIVAYMAFNPAKMRLDQGNDIALTVIGDQGIGVVKGTSTAGKVYEPGKRYTATVSASAESTENALNQWIEIPKPNKGQILVMTDDPFFYSSQFHYKTRIEGTNFLMLSEVEQPDDNHPITVLQSNALVSQLNLLAVQLPEGIQEIGNSCFSYCTSLSSVKLPSSGTLKTIGDHAFDFCKSLTSIDFPDGLTTIGTYAFKNTPILKAAFPESLESIGEYAFTHCSQLNSVYIPEKISTLSEQLFCDCFSLETVTGCKGVTTIDRFCFSGCSNLLSYPFTDKVTTLGDYAFNYCEKMTEPLPFTINKMGSWVICGTGITEFTLTDNLVKSSSPGLLIGAKHLNKLIVITTHSSVRNLLPSGTDYAQPENIDLYLLKDWAEESSYEKPDVANKTWYYNTWKSITLIDKDGNPVVQ